MNRNMLLVIVGLVVAAGGAWYVWGRASSDPATIKLSTAPRTGERIDPSLPPPPTPRPSLTTSDVTVSTGDLNEEPEPTAVHTIIDHRTPGAGVGTSPGQITPAAEPRPGLPMESMRQLQNALRPAMNECGRAVAPDKRTSKARATAKLTASVADGQLAIADVDVTTSEVDEPDAATLRECVKRAAAAAKLSDAGPNQPKLELNLTFVVR